ncbi:MAG: carbohydrate porin [Verrucomicrobiota bacterium]
MKQFLTVCLLSIASVSMSAVEVGDTRKTVVAELGFPIGELDLGDKVRVMFANGDVTFQEGVVVKFDLKSDAQLAHEANVKAKQAEYWAGVREEDLKNRIEKGKTWLASLENGVTQVTERQMQGILAHWSRLRSDFPDADVTADYEATLALAEAHADDIARQREEARIAALERRVADAERRAASAQQQAYDAQRSNYYWPAYYSAPRSVVVVTDGSKCVIPYRNNQPKVRANVNTGNFNLTYTSGYGSGIGCITTPNRPIVVTTTKQVVK